MRRGKHLKLAMFRQLNELVLNAWFYGVCGLLTPLYVVLFFVPVALTRLFLPRRLTLALLRASINRYGRLVAYAAWPWLRVRLHQPSPMAPGPCIFVENHLSAFDPFLQGFLPCELVQAARGWALRFPLIGVFARLAGYLDIDALPPDELARRAEQLLAAGVSVVFFPEGTRHPDGRLGPFHGTAFRLAQAANRPLVPVVIVGAADWIRKGSLWVRPARIDLHCLPPVTPAEFAGLSPFVLKQRVRSRLAAALRELGIDAEQTK